MELPEQLLQLPTKLQLVQLRPLQGLPALRQQLHMGPRRLPALWLQKPQGLQPQRRTGLRRRLALWQQLPLMPQTQWQAQRKRQNSNEFQQRKTPGEAFGRAKCHNGCSGASDTFDTQ
jgi:hypothetical protein